MATSARRIIIKNPQLSSSEKTQLDADYSTGALTLTVVSNFGYQDNDIVVVGEPGTEKSEGSDVTGTAGNTTINISATLKFNHQAGTPVYRSEFDQVEVSYMPSGGSWTVLDTVGIKWDDYNTIYVHQGGVNSDSYRFRFKNSASGNTSEYSPTILGSGYPKNSVGYMVENVRKTINDPDGKIVSTTDIIRFLTMAKDVIRGRRTDWWFWEKEDQGTITTVASQRNYNLDDISTRIEMVRDVRVLDASVSPNELYHIRYLPKVEFDYEVIDQSEATDDHLDIYTVLPSDSSSTAGYIAVDPAPANTGNGSFYIRYYEPDADYEDVADTTSIPFPHILELYAVAKCEQLKGNDDRASFYERLFNGPASKSRDNQSLTGIALLEQMHKDKVMPTKQPRQLKKFTGRRPIRRLYQSRLNTNRDELVERYW